MSPLGAVYGEGHCLTGEQANQLDADRRPKSLQIIDRVHATTETPGHFSTPLPLFTIARLTIHAGFLPVSP
jgi:hypothetical protein